MILKRLSMVSDKEN